MNGFLGTPDEVGSKPPFTGGGSQTNIPYTFEVKKDDFIILEPAEEIKEALAPLIEEDRSKLDEALVTEGSDTYFKTTEGAITEIESSDIITGLTVEKFNKLFLTNGEDAIKLAEVVGGYVWKNSPRIWTPAGREAVRSIKEDIEEGIKFLKDAINLLVISIVSSILFGRQCRRSLPWEISLQQVSCNEL